MAAWKFANNLGKSNRSQCLTAEWASYVMHGVLYHCHLLWLLLLIHIVMTYGSLESKIGLCSIFGQPFVQPALCIKGVSFTAV